MLVGQMSPRASWAGGMALPPLGAHLEAAYLNTELSAQLATHVGF